MIRSKQQYPFLVIPRRSKCKFIWDCFFQIILIVVYFSLPVQIAFFEESELLPDSSPILVWVILLFYWIDIFLKMRTTYTTTEFVEVTNSKQIALKYIKNKWFLVDSISSMPLFVFGYLNVSGITRRFLLGNLLLRLVEMDFTKMETLLPFKLKRAWRLITTIAKFILLV